MYSAWKNVVAFYKVLQINDFSEYIKIFLSFEVRTFFLFGIVGPLTQTDHSDQSQR